MFKIIATVVRMRIQKVLEPKLQKTQYGFRPKKSTTNAFQIVRRLQNRMERAGNTAHFEFWDWEKAFDKINNKMLFKALSELGVDKHLAELCKALYKYKDFEVMIDG